MRKLMIAAVMTTSAVALSACSGMNQTQESTAAGAGLGAVVGGVASGSAGGALLGGAAGAGAGYLYDQVQRNERDYDDGGGLFD
jgi:hypothetical protein